MTAVTRFLKSLFSASSAPARPVSKTRLGIESLEAREVPSVTSMGISQSQTYGTKQIDLGTNNNASNVTITRANNQIVVKDTTNGFSRSLIATGIQAVVFIGGNGNDTVRLNIADVSLRAYGYGGNDYLEGYGKDDLLDGGDNNDTLVGFGGNDKLYGRAGTDNLSGGGNTGDWLEAGSAGETATGGWNAHKPVVDGMKYTDIQQGSMNNCAVLASLGSAVRTGQVKDANIAYLGDFTYRVTFYDAQHRAITEDVTFTGTTTALDPVSKGYESWTIIYNRAYFERFHNLNYVTNPTAGAAFGGEHTDVAMVRLMAYSYKQFANGSAEFTATKMKQILDAGWAMTACLDAYPGGTLSAHAYMVNRVYTATGIAGRTDTYVELYNPWGRDALNGGGRTKNGRIVSPIGDGTSDGRITLLWSDFVALTRYYAW